MQKTLQNASWILTVFGLKVDKLFQKTNKE